MPKIKKTIRFILLFASLSFFWVARAETLKIGFITDWEYGTKKRFGHKLPNKADDYLKKAVNHFNNIFHPDLAVGGGDYILSRSVSQKKARNQLKYINGIFRKVAAPRLYCVGNHDVSDMSEAKVQEILGIETSHSAIDLNGFRVIVLDTNEFNSRLKKYEVVGRVSSDELIWLENQLNTSLPVIVFSHHSPIQTHEGNVSRTNIYDAPQVRQVLEKYNNVVAVFSGHHAINYHTKINEVNYIIINNLTDKKALGSYADITIEKQENVISVSAYQYGKKPATYIFQK